MSLGCFREFLGFGDSFLYGANHVEGRLGEVIVVAVAKALEALDCVSQRHLLAGGTGEHFGDCEGLRHETLDLTRAGYRHLVVFGKFIHAENGDDVLQRLVLLQDRLNAPRNRIVLFADDARVKHAGVESSGSTAG